MNEIKCRIKGCPSVFRTEEPVSPKAKYSCNGRGADGFPIPGHTRKDLVEAAGRIYDGKKDNRDAEVKFQDHQFDDSLSFGGSSGTYNDDDMNRRKDND